ncbi:NADH-ubiquinone oxidoreductase-F iron-sulfur binding region domain-containing protein [Dermacoccaceae bacterium W4C1]
MRDNGSQTLIALLGQAGLGGRGGGGFPTARKLALARERGAELIVNACDGEIGQCGGSWIVAEQLTELLAGARLLGGRHVRFAAHRDSPTLKRLQMAGLPTLDIPARYVSSEESAVAAYAAGGLARPLMRWQPITAGASTAEGRPVPATLVLNAETVWRTAQIADRGAAWFRSHGTADEPGPRLASVRIASRAPVVVHAEAGVGLGDLMSAAGFAGDPMAVGVGGLAGGFVPNREHRAAREVRWEQAELAPFGARISSGVVQVLDEQWCPWDVIEKVVTFAAGESAGQCGPCMFGLPSVAADLRELTAGRADHQVENRLRGRLGMLPGRGACRHPDGVAGYLSSALSAFGQELAAHREGGCTFAGRVAGPGHIGPDEAPEVTHAIA